MYIPQKGNILSFLSYFFKMTPTIPIIQAQNNPCWMPNGLQIVSLSRCCWFPFNGDACFLGSQVVLVVKNPPVNAGQKMQARSLGREDPLEEEISTHTSILAWIIPWTEELPATVHGVTNSWTRLKQLSMHACFLQLPSTFPPCVTTVFRACNESSECARCSLLDTFLWGRVNDNIISIFRYLQMTSMLSANVW